MKSHKYLGIALAGFGAGAVNGLFGAGGGMVLVPLLGLLTNISEENVFPTSISVILPICLVSLSVTAFSSPIPWQTALPYLICSAVGGILAGMLGRRIPVLWLHRLLGIMILWGGIRYLC